MGVPPTSSPLGPRAPESGDEFKESPDIAQSTPRGSLTSLNRKLTHSVTEIKQSAPYREVSNTLSQVKTETSQALEKVKGTVKDPVATFKAVTLYLSKSPLLGALGQFIFKTQTMHNPDLTSEDEALKIKENLDKMWEELNNDNLVAGDGKDAKNQLKDALPGDFRAWISKDLIYAAQKTGDDTYKIFTFSGKKLAEIEQMKKELVEGRQQMNETPGKLLDQMWKDLQSANLEASDAVDAKKQLNDALPGDFRAWKANEIIFAAQKTGDDTYKIFTFSGVKLADVKQMNQELVKGRQRMIERQRELVEQLKQEGNFLENPDQLSAKELEAFGEEALANAEFGAYLVYEDIHTEEFVILVKSHDIVVKSIIQPFDDLIKSIKTAQNKI